MTYTKKHPPSGRLGHQARALAEGDELAKAEARLRLQDLFSRA